MKFLFKLAFFLAVSTGLAAQAAPIPGQGTWETTLLARDLDGDDSNGAEAYYDTARDITWLADAALLGTVPLYEVFNSFTSSVSVYGTTGWRVPSTPCGIHDCTEPFEEWYLKADFHHLFTITLGNSRENYTFESVNTGPFLNVVKGLYGTYGPVAHCGGGGCTQAFDTEKGSAVIKSVISEEPVGIWLIHEGDIAHATQVPEPSSVALGMIGGLFFAILKLHKTRRINFRLLPGAIKPRWVRMLQPERVKQWVA